MNALILLTEEHQVLRPFLARLRQAANSGPEQELALALAAAKTALGEDLDHHIALEDEQLFPLIARSLGEGLIVPFVDDHRRIQQVRNTLYAAPGSQARTLALTLEDMLGDHLAREEEILFPSAQEALSAHALEVNW